MKRILFGLLMLVALNGAWSQDAVKARIEYEEAEVAYAENNYELALVKLTEVEKLLKSTNPRTLYLKINAQWGLIQKNPYQDFALLQDVRRKCSQYLKNYAKLPNNEQRFRAVYKIEQELGRYPKTIEAFEIKHKEDVAAKAQSAEVQKQIAELIKTGSELRTTFKWQPNLTESEFTGQNPIISNYKWERFSTEGSIVISRKVGTPLSVGGYYPDGPQNYVINKNGFVAAYSFLLRKEKNDKKGEVLKMFEDANAKDKGTKYYSYVENDGIRSYTIRVPVSVDKPDEIHYSITLQYILVGAFSVLTITFT